VRKGERFLIGSGDLIYDYLTYRGLSDDIHSLPASWLLGGASLFPLFCRDGGIWPLHNNSCMTALISSDISRVLKNLPHQ